MRSETSTLGVQKIKILIFIILILNSFVSCFSHSDPFWDMVEINSKLTIEKNKILFNDILSLPLNDNWKTKEEIIEITQNYYNKNFFIIHKNNNCNLKIEKVWNDWEHTMTEGFFTCLEEVFSLEELYIKNSLFIDYPYTSWNIFLEITDNNKKKNIILTDTRKEFAWIKSGFVEKKATSIEEYKAELEKEKNISETNISEKKDNNLLIIINKFIKLWIDHIIDWIDHILFLVVLILTTFRFKNILFLITGFTVSHSITIILAWMWLISVTSKIVEPIIALSIIFMAISNLIYFSSKKTKKKNKLNKRIWITFIFGLFHWLGFAGALSENAIIPEDYILTSLISFNIWVELWQIVIILLIFPFLILLKKYYDLFWKKVLQLISLIIALISIYWFFERVI